MAESAVVRFERFILENEDGGEPRSFSFHPALTLVAGQGVAERAEFAEQLISSLVGGRKGSHAEIRTDQGSKLAVVRSTKVDDLVVDADRTDDVTAEYTDDQGTVDVLAALGLDTSLVRIELEAVHHGTLSHRGADDRDLDRLARIDQPELWQLANDIAVARAEAEDAETQFLDMLQAQEEAAADDNPERAEALDVLQEVVFETEHTNRRARIAFMILSIVAFIGAFGFMVSSPSLVSRIACGASVLAVAWGLLGIMQMLRQERKLRSGDDDVGLFASQVRQVDGILSSGARRRAVRESRSTLETLEADWAGLTAGAELGWVISHKRLIQETAALHRTAGLDPALASDSFGALVTRISTDANAEVRFEESLPLLFSEPFGDMNETEVQVALQLLATSAQSRQRIVLTENTVALAWARRAEEQQYLHVEEVTRTSV